ncbi:formimidoylglutamate deiminase [soil metagenome]
MSGEGSWWCELAWLGGEKAEAGVHVEAIDGRFSTVEPGHATPPEGATRLPGLTVPGFANAHSHAFHRALRGHTHRGGGTFWDWRDTMYEVAGSLDPDTYFELARATFAEMALAGITAVGEFHYLHHDTNGRPYGQPNAMGEAVIAAAGDAGVRITLLDTCYLHGGVGEAAAGVQQRFSDGDVERWAERAEALPAARGAVIGAAIHSIRAVGPEEAATVAAWAAERNCPLHAHVSEQPAENEACREAYGKTPVEVLSDAGALGGRFTAIHATNLEPSDIALLGASASCCCFCPTTERDLADGIGPASALLAAGSSLSLGSDSHAVIDMLEEARAVDLDERLATGRRGTHDAPSLLLAATRACHMSIGDPSAGAIEPGARADLVSIGLSDVRTAGATADSALDAVVFAASAADVESVIRDCETIVSEGRHRSIDVAAALTRTIGGIFSLAPS